MSDGWDIQRLIFDGHRLAWRRRGNELQYAFPWAEKNDLWKDGTWEDYALDYADARNPESMWERVEA